MKIVLTLCALLTLSLSASAANNLYVSPYGSDKADGSKTRPFRTIQKAVDTYAKSSLYPEDLHINLFGGRYELTKTVEIKDLIGIIIKPVAGESVVLTGARTISSKLAKPVSDPAVRAAIGNPAVREIDASKLGITLEPLHTVGFGRPSLPSWNELFIDGRAGHIARYPNDTVMMIGKIHNTGDIPRENITGRGDAVFEYSDTRVNRWAGAGDMWISGYFAHGYADDMIPVRSIDTTARTVTTALATRYGFMTGAPWRTWFALNIPSEIDVPGEYVIDSKANKLYFMANGNAQLSISVLEGPMIAIENSQRIRIEGLTIEQSRGIGVYMAGSTRCEVQGCTLRNLGNWAVCIGQGQGAGSNQNSPSDNDPRIMGDVEGALYANNLHTRNGGTKNSVRDCYIYNIGSGGVMLSGGDRKTLTPAGNYVENCVIRDYNRIEKSYKGAVTIDGVGNRVSKVDISGAPSMAILIHGNDHVIEYCKITDVCREIDDQGAIYYGRDPSERGMIVRYNLFKDLSPRHRVTATYHDDGACGMTCIGNIYLRAGSGPVLIGGGHDNKYFNNIFIEGPQAIHIDNRMQNWGKGMIARGGIIDERLQAVRYTEPPYSTAYPELTKYWEGDPSQPRGNVFAGNVFVKVKSVLSGATQTQWGEFYNNFVTMENPGFADLGDPLKGFVEGAEIFERVDGFPHLPFDKIGCNLPTLANE